MIPINEIYDYPPVYLSHKSTIMPRLLYANELVALILKDLKKEKTRISKDNQINFSDCPELEDSELGPINQEKILFISIESLTQIQKKLSSFSGIQSIPKILPSAITIIRTLSSQIFSHFPASSRNLSDLSSLLGGILMDSATITGAKFDFDQSNRESVSLLDEAKLMVDSKISKQYPNLSILKAETTWNF